MNSNIASGYNLPPDPGGEFYVNMTFSVRVGTIYTTCFNKILHVAHTGVSRYHRILKISIFISLRLLSFVIEHKCLL